MTSPTNGSSSNFFSSGLRQKVDQLMDILWAGGVNNPMDSIEQISYLLFLRLLTEKDEVLATLDKKYARIFSGYVHDSSRRQYWRKVLHWYSMLPMISSSRSNPKRTKLIALRPCFLILIGVCWWSRSPTSKPHNRHRAKTPNSKWIRLGLVRWVSSN